jgi:hypothetical protein
VLLCKNGHLQTTIGMSALGQKPTCAVQNIMSALALAAGKADSRKRPCLKFKPWRLVACLAFSDANKAVAFDHYLKSGSGRAFIKKRLR